MSGKRAGTSPSVTSTTVKEHSLPSYARPYFEELLGRAGYEATRPYEPYGEARLADFNPYETSAMQGMQQMAAAGSPQQLTSAANIATGVGTQPGGAGSAIAGQFTPGTLSDPAMLESYMSPYQQSVIDIEKREAARQSGIMGGQIGQQAAQAGGLGGYREAIMQSERERNLGQQLGDIQSRGSQQGFQQAQRAFEADRGARLQAGELGLRGLAADQSTRDQQLRAASTLGALAPQEQAMSYERLKNLQAAGQTQRDLSQQGMSMGYQDFLRQQAFPREQLGLFSQMIQGLPVTPGASYGTFGGPSPYQQMLGAGISGVGLYNAMNRPTGFSAFRGGG